MLRSDTPGLLKCGVCLVLCHMAPIVVVLSDFCVFSCSRFSSSSWSVLISDKLENQIATLAGLC